AQAVVAAISAKDDAGMAGIHLEGPHIAPGRRGTHALEHVRKLDNHTLAAVEHLAANAVPTLITVAPEMVTVKQIATLTNMGAIVSLGHTDASAQVMAAAFDAGASCATHLFNAMSPMLGRAPGAVGAAINSTAYVGLICDGHHVSDDMVALAIRARPVPDRMMLVSDAMPTVGGADQFDLYGQTITLDNGRLVNREGSLAGAHTTQLAGVKRLVENSITPLDEALRMAITNPANCIGKPALASMLNRPVSELIMLDENLFLVDGLQSMLCA
ncbi:MAG: N-acetylglucosamine-6-phosphate deacetylase, partial [Pseudomonadota bacterium]